MGGGRVWHAVRARSAHAVQQLARCDVETLRDLEDRRKAWIPLGELEPRDLGEVDAAAVGQRHLREAGRGAHAADVGSELLAPLHRPGCLASTASPSIADSSKGKGLLRALADLSSSPRRIATATGAARSETPSFS